MPLFIIETTAESLIREFWQVEAATAQDARDKFDNGETGAFLWDEVTGDETGREVSQVHGADDLAGTVAIHRAQQAAPAMLAALQELVADATGAAVVARNQANTAGDYSAAYVTRLTRAIEAGRAAITAATAQQSPATVAQPDEDEHEALSTYRITETAVYLVKAEDEAHAERRFVCEVGIHAECFHAVEGRTIELVEEEEEFTCTACGRDEGDCSADPCEAVIEDRES